MPILPIRIPPAFCSHQSFFAGRSFSSPKHSARIPHRAVGVRYGPALMSGSIGMGVCQRFSSIRNHRHPNGAGVTLDGTVCYLSLWIERLVITFYRKTKVSVDIPPFHAAVIPPKLFKNFCVFLWKITKNRSAKRLCIDLIKLSFTQSL